jgi:hypothetical protein
MCAEKKNVFKREKKKGYLKKRDMHIDDRYAYQVDIYNDFIYSRIKKARARGKMSR